MRFYYNRKANDENTSDIVIYSSVMKHCFSQLLCVVLLILLQTCSNYYTYFHNLISDIWVGWPAAAPSEGWDHFHTGWGTVAVNIVIETRTVVEGAEIACFFPVSDVVGCANHSCCGVTGVRWDMSPW